MIFKKLLLKADASSLQDPRIGKYRAPELSTPEFGSAHRQYKTRTYTIFSVMHVLDYMNFHDEVGKYVDSSKWSSKERRDHLQKIVGKHRRRVR